MTGRWLALDTATELSSVAVGVPPATESAVTLIGVRLQAAEIIEMVDRCLDPLGIRPAQLAGIVVGDGPGSFTGLRIGWAAGKGLAQEHGLALRAIPSLLAAAAGAAGVLGSVPIGVCFDALRGQVYGMVGVIYPTHVEMLVAPRVCTLPELVEASAVRPRAVVEDGATRAPREVEAWTGAPPLALAQLRPTAASLLALCARPGVGRVLENLTAAEPQYGRPAEAQARWEARHGRPLPDPSRPRG
jgi:tRNA threonylcarbamoyladenosine biosynthesis protein TsaB